MSGSGQGALDDSGTAVRHPSTLAAHSRYIAAHSTMARSTAAPVPSAGSGRGCGHGWRRLAGIVAGNGAGDEAQAVIRQAYSSGSSRIGNDDTLDLPGDDEALPCDAGTLDLEAACRSVSRALCKALALGVSLRAPAVCGFPAQRLQPPSAAEARSRRGNHRAGQQLHG